MYITTQLELCLYEQTQIVANAAVEWGASNFLVIKLTSCSFPYFLLQSVLPFYIFKFSFIYSKGLPVKVLKGQCIGIVYSSEAV